MGVVLFINLLHDLRATTLQENLSEDYNPISSQLQHTRLIMTIKKTILS